MNNLMDTLLADGKRLKEQQERRAHPEPAVPATRAEQIIAEGYRKRHVYRCAQPNADTSMVNGVQVGHLHGEVTRLCNELESFNVTRDPALRYEDVYCSALDADVTAGFNYEPGSAPRITSAQYFERTGDPGDPGEAETIELMEAWVNGVNIIGGISEVASEQISDAALEKYHARQAKAPRTRWAAVMRGPDMLPDAWFAVALGIALALVLVFGPGGLAS